MCVLAPSSSGSVFVTEGDRKVCTRYGCTFLKKGWNSGKMMQHLATCSISQASKGGETPRSESGILIEDALRFFSNSEVEAAMRLFKRGEVSAAKVIENFLEVEPLYLIPKNQSHHVNGFAMNHNTLSLSQNRLASTVSDSSKS